MILYLKRTTIKKYGDDSLFEENTNNMKANNKPEKILIFRE